MIHISMCTHLQLVDQWDVSPTGQVRINIKHVFWIGIRRYRRSVPPYSMGKNSYEFVSGSVMSSNYLHLRSLVRWTPSKSSADCCNWVSPEITSITLARRGSSDLLHCRGRCRPRSQRKRSKNSRAEVAWARRPYRVLFIASWTA